MAAKEVMAAPGDVDLTFPSTDIFIFETEEFNPSESFFKSQVNSSHDTSRQVKSNQTKSSQVKSTGTPVGAPNVRAEAESKNVEAPKFVEPTAVFQKNVKATITRNRTPGNMEAERRIGPHFPQQFPNCAKLCTPKTFPL